MDWERGTDARIWGRGDGGGRGNKGGDWIIIKYEISRLEHLEHYTTIGNNVMNENGIADF